MAQLQFDATTVNPAGDRGPAPEGTYKVILSNSDIKPGKGATDRMMNCQFKILEGPIGDAHGVPSQAGGVIFQNFNIQHSNPVAQQIGQERLSALCHCVGILKITDTQQLHGRPLQIKVSIREGEDQKRYNEILAFMKEDGSPAASATPAAGAPGGAPAWAQAAAPTAAPVASAPVPAPAAPPVQTAPPPVAAQPPQLYSVACNGAVIAQGVTADQIRAMPQFVASPDSILVVPNGGTAWAPGSTLVVAPAPVAPPVPAAPAIPSTAPAAEAPPGVPPWLAGKV